MAVSHETTVSFAHHFPDSSRVMTRRCRFNRLLGIATAMLTGFGAIPAVADDNFGPDWVEDGDAGNTLESAQRVKGNSSSVNTLNGATGGGGGFNRGSGGDFQDIYLVYIADPDQFTASTVGPEGDANFDTRMWLFRYDGPGVLAADDASDADNRTFLRGFDLPDQEIFKPGVYGLAIGGTPNIPVNLFGNPMFPPAAPGQTVGPSQKGALSPLGDWNPLEGTTGSYRIAMTGVRFIPLPCGEGGDCFIPGNAPGCASLDCCTLVCDRDPFCCDTVWDRQCANIASLICVGCGAPAAGPCDLPHPGPYCEDGICCQLVCDIDPLCCTANWDAGCASIAEDNCVDECPSDCPGDFNGDGIRNGGDLGSLLAAWNQPGCTDLDHSGKTDGADLGLLLGLLGPCSNCGDPSAGSCFDPHQSPGCGDTECCNDVCEIDPACCENAWDVQCVKLAAKSCATECGDADAGSCLEAHPGPGCEDSDCCRRVCEVLPRCCDLSWDEACAQFALQLPGCVD